MSMAIKPYKILLLLLFIILCCWAYFDVSTSQQAGMKEADRGITHIFIFLSVFIHLLYVFFNSRNIFKRVNYINLTLFAIVIWYTIVDIVNNSNLRYSTTLIMLSLWWFLTYNFCYLFLKKSGERYHTVINMYLILSIVYIILNVYARNQIQINLNQEYAVTGYAYYIVIFIPYILLLENRIVKMILMITACVMILTSFKRGVIVTLPVMLFIYGYVKSIYTKKWESFIAKCLLIFIVAIPAFILVDKISMGFMSERFSSESLADGSGRTTNRNLALSAINNRDFVNLLIGSGHGSSVELIGTGVHNEWLEFLFSFGVIGLILYTILGILFLYECIKGVKKRLPYAPHMCMMMGYYYMVSIFSGFYGVYVTYYFFVFMSITRYLNEKSLQSRNSLRYVIC